MAHNASSFFSQTQAVCLLQELSQHFYIYPKKWYSKQLYYPITIQSSMATTLGWEMIPTLLVVSGLRMSTYAQDSSEEIWNTSATPMWSEVSTWSAGNVTSLDRNITSLDRNVTSPLPDLVPRPEDEDRNVKWIYIPLVTIGIIGNCLFLIG